MITFSKKDIKNEFEFGAYTRGIGYFNQGRVCALKTTKETTEFIDLYGEVNGTLKYEQKITVYNETWGADFEGECSCPVGYNCKHVVAVLLEYLTYIEQTSTQHSAHSFSKPQHKQPAYATSIELEGWLKQFQIDKQKPQEESLFDERKWFAYVLSPTAYPGKVSVKLFQSGYKVHGGYYKPKRQDFSQQLHNIRYGYSAAFINDIDKDILRRLDVSERRQFHYNDIYLEGQLGWQALIKMIKTRRCFWGSMDNEPLTIGNKIPVQLNWEHSKNKGITVYKLNISSGNNIQLILTDPVCQINIECNQLEELDSDLTTEQFAQLLSTPTIAEKDIEQFNLDLIKNSIDRHIPLPINNSVEDLSDTKVIPKAIISTLNDPNTQLPPIHCLKLSLLYGDREVQLTDEMTLVEKKAKTIFRLTRDRDNEMALLQPIFDLGFELKTVSKEDKIIPDRAIAVMGNEDGPIVEMNKWRQFLETDRYLLQQDGWQIEQHSGFYLDFIHPHDEWDVDIESDNDWFSLKFDIQLGDSDETKLSLLPIISKLLSQYNPDELPEEIPVEHHPGQFLILPKEKIQP
ncbi:MAG: hypothetical protein GY781_14170, partial [Gammaproteobacteria bacterium]|nr:hypothetical protein [Gammaproteobacteria bacterium]